MANINEELTREFFEQNGFSVKLQHKYLVTGSDRNQVDHIDLLVFNTTTRSIIPIPNFVLQMTDIPNIERAAIGIRGWHTETFSPSVLHSSPEVFYFAEVDPQKVSQKFFREKPFVNIMVLPMLPQNEIVRQRSIELLKENKVTYVIEFKTILEDLIDRVRINRNYIESNVLQFLRILKRYNLLRQYQLDFFEK
ncbi:hypothetical protein ACFL1T_04455 [Chlamydiota bacterium]